MKKIVILASGNGSNAESIIRYFKLQKKIKISCIISNNKDAYVLDRAKKHNIPHFVIQNNRFDENKTYDFFKGIKPDLIVLAGFLIKIPVNIINNFCNKIVNIHPSLLPLHGGKGMYGLKVHESVKKNNDSVSGITIHYVNENYDEGEIIFQKKIKINSADTVKIISDKIKIIEHKYYPKVIESLLN
tara:strand:+ start:152470 stop:153030 length:561 start_codon:yes stop_codon:yes gene_type:complete